MNDNLEVEVFRAGDYGEKGRWDAGALDQIAADYNTTLHEAPVTLDHARRGPALGWVEALRRVGDRLVARLRGLNVKLLELLRTGAFKKRSVEIYPALRETGRPYLRAVSFLGAAVPEVKGLADPLIPDAAGAGAGAFEGNAEAGIVFDEAIGKEEIDYEHEHEQEENCRQDAGATSFAEVAAKLRAAGTWRPAWGERGIAAFYGALAALGEIEVGEGHGIAPAAWFAEFLESLPPVVALGETAPAAGAEWGGLMTGTACVDPASLALHRAAVAFQQGNPGIQYSEALVRCAGRV